MCIETVQLEHPTAPRLAVYRDGAARASYSATSRCVQRRCSQSILQRHVSLCIQTVQLEHPTAPRLAVYRDGAARASYSPTSRCVQRRCSYPSAPRLAVYRDGAARASYSATSRCIQRRCSQSILQRHVSLVSRSFCQSTAQKSINLFIISCE